jgi:hypothetical protein
MIASGTPRALADRAAVVDLLHGLGRWLDDNRFEEADALFAEHAAVTTPGGTVSGMAGVIEQARRGHDQPTQHRITNVLVELQGDRAVIAANLVATWVDGPDARRVVGGRYECEAQRTSAGWRLTRLNLIPSWQSYTPAA